VPGIVATPLMEAAAPVTDMSRSARDRHAAGNNSADSVIARADGGCDASDSGDATRAVVRVGCHGCGRVDGGGRARGVRGGDGPNGAVTPSSPSATGQTKAGVSEMFAENIGASEAFVPMPPTSAATG
jgi:hypothetical protein